MTSQKRYIVRTQQGSGAAYLQVRSNRSTDGKYRWDKTRREVAAVLTEGQARSAARNYGGKIVLI